MSEILCLAFAKRLVNLVQDRLRFTLRTHQWRVNLLDACEAPGHWRTTLEPLIQGGTLEPMVVADLDLVNELPQRLASTLP